MKYDERRATLADGTIITLRSPAATDAQAIQDFLLSQIPDKNLLPLLPRQDEITLDRAALWATRCSADPKSILIGAFRDGALIGMAQVSPASLLPRCAHRANVGLAVTREDWHLGLGTILMRESIAAAQRSRFERLESSIVLSNERAFKLCVRFGFQTMGSVSCAYKFEDSHYEDERMLSLDLRV